MLSILVPDSVAAESPPHLAHHPCRTGGAKRNDWIGCLIYRMQARNPCNYPQA